MYNFMENKTLKALINKGVQIPNPGSVHISDDINPDRISGDNVVVHSGCKLLGSQTLISPGCQLGYEAPVTLENVWLGRNCQLKGGYFKKAAFCGDNVFGSGAHVRAGTILEEQANAAHTVGLKQTILFPFVTLGSLINFCDCLMAGGTSRKDHSEVGSSFVHFNYTPNQDKATPSMMGDVAAGVMLKSKPIFLGGQGGLVGPVRINYGCMTAAGSIIRNNELKPDRLLVGGGFKSFSIPRQSFVYKNIGHIFNNNVYYISSLLSLKTWYTHVRPLFTGDFFSTQVLKGMKDILDDAIQERINRFGMFCDKLKVSKQNLLSDGKDESSESVATHDTAMAKKEMVLERVAFASENQTIDPTGIDFVEILANASIKDDYISAIQNLTQTQAKAGTDWLEQIQKEICRDLFI